MPVSELCNREVVIVQPNDTALEAARLMRQHHVGDVVVVEDRDGVRTPVGLVTDRDLVMEIMAQTLGPADIRVKDFMQPDLATIEEEAGLFEAVGYMRLKGVRRLPVVAHNGGLVGILTLDDVLELLSEELAALSKLVKHEQQVEVAIRH